MSKHNFTSVRPTPERTALFETICAHLALDPKKHSARLNAIDFALRIAAREIGKDDTMYINAWEINTGNLRQLVAKAVKEGKVKTDWTVWCGPAGDVFITKSASDLSEEEAEYIDSGLVEEYLD